MTTKKKGCAQNGHLRKYTAYKIVDSWHLPVSQSVQAPNNANNANALTI